MTRQSLQLGLLTGGLLLLTACAVPQKPVVLAFFFDGVSPAIRVTAPASAPGPEPMNSRIPDLYVAARAEPPGVRHRPYAERECLSCHESQFSQKLRTELPALCLSCHPAMAAPQLYPHAPVAQGQCLVCHHPHESLEPSLLVGSGWRLCGGCHEERLVSATPAHAGAGGDLCQNCHDPHGGRDPHLLRALPTERASKPAAPGSL